MKNKFEQYFFSEIFPDEMHRVEEGIFQSVKTDAGIPSEAARHIFAAGGKRIRARLAILCGKLLHSRAMDKNISLAVAMEILHAATLLHDDIIDDARLRRGKLATHITWGNKTAILLGDLFLSRALGIITSLKHPEILELFTSVMEEIITGELLQLSQRGNAETSANEYFEIIRKKTAEFFAVGCAASAILSEASSEEIEALKNYGLNLGIVFQLVDDLFDYIADEENTGKPIGTDLKEGRITLPLILAYEKANEAEKKKIKATVAAIYASKEIAPDNFLSSMVEKYESLKVCEKIICEYTDKAKASLKIFSNRELAQDFSNLVDFCIMRRF